jgi:hypothetical protein
MNDKFLPFFLGFATTLVVFFVFLEFFVFQSPSPDENVLKVAKSLTDQPIVSDGRRTFFGCKRGDIYVYEVTNPNGKYVGYVCQGFLKGATARF